MIRHVDQFCAGFATGDAISNEALILQDFLQRFGIASTIYSQHFNENDAHLVRHYKEYRDDRNSILIYHHSFYSDFLKQLKYLRSRRILVFHNMTPPEYVQPYNREIAEQLRYTRDLLSLMNDDFDALVADSHYNAHDLEELGFRNIDVMPVAINYSNWSNGQPDPAHLDFLNDDYINIIFVGRVFPNKKHQDLLKSFYYFRKIEPRSRLIILGAYHPGVRGYTAELMNLTRELNLERHVLYTGMVSQAEVRTYYRRSHLFLSMSEHEGFFVPLVECMYLDIPILAYASSVVPETLGKSGVLFYEKDYRRIAEMMALMVNNKELRSATLATQQERRKAYMPAQTFGIFTDVLSRFGLNF